MGAMRAAERDQEEREQQEAEARERLAQLLQSLPPMELADCCCMLAGALLKLVGPKLRVLSDTEVDPLDWWIELPTPEPVLVQKSGVEGLYEDEQAAEKERLEKERAAKEDHVLPLYMYHLIEVELHKLSHNGIH